MATFDYAGLKLDVDELIAEFGQTVQLRSFSSSGSNFNPTLTPTDVNVTAAIVDYTTREVDNDKIMATDKRALIAVGSIAAMPTTAQKIVVNSIAYAIINCNSVNPAGTPVLYDVQLRL